MSTAVPALCPRVTCLRSRRFFSQALIACLAPGLAVLAPAALAQEADPRDPNDTRGVYLGIGAGRSTYGVDTSGIDRLLVAGGFASSATTADDTDTSISASVGLRFGYRFAVEASYLDFGTAGTTSTVGAPAGSVSGSFAVDGVSLDLLLLVPVDREWIVYGKLGAIRWDSETRLAGSIRATDSGTDLKLGLGWQWEYNRSLGVRLEFEHYELGDADADLVSLGMLFRF